VSLLGVSDFLRVYPAPPGVYQHSVRSTGADVRRSVFSVFSRKVFRVCAFQHSTLHSNFPSERPGPHIPFRPRKNGCISLTLWVYALALPAQALI